MHINLPGAGFEDTPVDVRRFQNRHLLTGERRIRPDQAFDQCVTPGKEILQRLTLIGTADVQCPARCQQRVRRETGGGMLEKCPAGGSQRPDRLVAIGLGEKSRRTTGRVITGLGLGFEQQH